MKVEGLRIGECDIIRVPDACRILGIQRATLYRLIRDGVLPAFRLSPGGRWRFNKRILEEWVNDKQGRGI